ncbi:MAG: hypothetical protein H0V70_27675 [Ktedonobacteraceae bacterium]|nr:hypothetical protein [Ktedonobacteraceae bacterium]
MAETNTVFNAEKLEKVQALLQSLKEDAQKADADGDMFMLSVYNDLLHVCSPIVVKSLARLEREENAVLNKREKEMRKQVREERAAQKLKA